MELNKQEALNSYTSKSTHFQSSLGNNPGQVAHQLINQAECDHVPAGN